MDQIINGEVLIIVLVDGLIFILSEEYLAFLLMLYIYYLPLYLEYRIFLLQVLPGTLIHHHHRHRILPYSLDPPILKLPLPHLPRPPNTSFSLTIIQVQYLLFPQQHKILRPTQHQHIHPNLPHHKHIQIILIEQVHRFCPCTSTNHTNIPVQMLHCKDRCPLEQDSTD
jgi:hypothetical protein